jgi:protein-S-isoprenylcysteine O-methyltransferase Ste14
LEVNLKEIDRNMKLKTKTKTKNILNVTLLSIIVTVLVYWFAQHQISLVFSLAAVGYPKNPVYVILNFILISVFVLTIGFRRRIARLPASIYLAFIVALYIEMYGFPLTMYFFSWAFGTANIVTLWCLLTTIIEEKLFYTLFMAVIVPISNIIIITGVLLVIYGWTKIYKAKNQLITTGIYAQLRHPQYLGFLLITLGMNVLWVTFSTLILWPILVLLYCQLAKDEDKQMEKKFGEQFTEYKNNVPMFIPKLLKI